MTWYSVLEILFSFEIQKYDTNNTITSVYILVCDNKQLSCINYFPKHPIYKSYMQMYCHLTAFYCVHDLLR